MTDRKAKAKARATATAKAKATATAKAKAKAKATATTGVLRFAHNVGRTDRQKGNSNGNGNYKGSFAWLRMTAEKGGSDVDAGWLGWG